MDHEPLSSFHYTPSPAVKVAGVFLLGAACGLTIGYFLGVNFFALKVNDVLEEEPVNAKHAATTGIKPPWTADQVPEGVERFIKDLEKDG